MSSVRACLLGALLAASGLAAGWIVGRSHVAMPMHAAPPLQSGGQKNAGRPILYYRDPMGGATSPVPAKDAMGMAFLPVYGSQDPEAPGMVSLSPRLVQETGVRTAVATRHDMEPTIRVVGTLRMAEPAQSVVSPRFSGWVERVFANATGETVRKGSPLLTLYSPEVAHIEAEYQFAGGDGTSADGTLQSLRALGVPEEELARLKRERRVNDHIVLRAPADGTILEKGAVAGARFAPGTVLYSLADLSRLWLIADVYEDDLPWILPGQNAVIHFVAWPGRAFAGRIDFVYPTVAEQTRTARVRIVLPDPQGVLKPGMFASAAIGGRIRRNVLTVPASAILDDGVRETVLIAQSGGHFLPRQVRTGLRAGDEVEILSGLTEGERIVTSATFLIDSESNLRAAFGRMAGDVMQTGATRE
ncbi:efflux RND transporter periplasmic adaptor subunit [Acidomonas methanolica]|uniref:efflux RND transporter periplasmic adaptor subunit n=1 Tax=Acidomonas methanolica TaxID=437 RepID=UPI002119F789|nr:efflux RND transporter periplasmic adaptor subunit [Acidomonas methanolica]MCQ9155726.1 efflux RND transporter periplasmic adaptor subunit [Acidomonas methanolica]